MRVAIHFCHYETLGHTNRVVCIAKALKKLYGDDVEVAVLQGGVPQDFIADPSFKLVNLPNPMADKRWFNNSRAKRFFDIKKAKERINFMKSFFRGFIPDVFVVEYFPFGRELAPYEVPQVIEYLKEINPKVKVISSVGYPVLNFPKGKTVLYSRFFDKIMIHVPEEMDLIYVKRCLKMVIKEDFNENAYIRTFKALKDKIVFTDYIVPESNKSPEEIRKELGISDEKLILVSRGGGAVYPKIIVNGALARKYFDDSYFFLIVGGPSSSDEEMRVVEGISQKFNKIKATNYVDNLVDYIGACDLSVSMTGYNTSVQTIYHQKSAVFFPKIDKIKNGNIEQAYRVKMLSDHLPCDVLDYNKATSKDLAESIKKVLNSERKAAKLGREMFNGAEISAKIIFDIARM